jgi:hypothetical protein
MTRHRGTGKRRHGRFSSTPRRLTQIANLKTLKNLLETNVGYVIGGYADGLIDHHESMMPRLIPIITA